MRSKAMCFLMTVIVSVPLCLQTSAAQGKQKPDTAPVSKTELNPYFSMFSGGLPLLKGIRGEWIAVAKNGNVYCSRGSQVWMKKPDGKVVLVAGKGNPGDAGDNGQAKYALLTSPTGLAIGPHGSLYIADVGNNNIRRVSPAGIITTVAGTGVAGYSGDGGPAIHAELDQPMGLAIGPHGSIYVVDHSNCRVRKINRSGIISTVAGDGVNGYGGDGGPAIQAELSSPMGVAVNRSGDIYVADWGNRRVREVSSEGIITTVAGDGYWSGYNPSGNGGPATSAELSGPRDVTVGRNGIIYIDDDWESAIREVKPDGIISTLVSTAELGKNGHGAITYLPVSSAIGPNGKLYFAEEVIGVKHVYSGPEGFIREVKIKSSSALASEGK